MDPKDVSIDGRGKTIIHENKAQKSRVEERLGAAISGCGRVIWSGRAGDFGGVGDAGAAGGAGFSMTFARIHL
jgi:hypothetical protein